MFVVSLLIYILCSAIAGSPLQCWDNSTRGLDSATALEFARTLRTSTELTGATAIVTLYQASQSIYDVGLTARAENCTKVRRSSTKLLCYTKVAKFISEISIMQKHSSSI